MQQSQLQHLLSFKPKGNESTLVTSIAYSPDGSLLASGGDESFVRLWNVREGKLKKITKYSSNAQIVFSTDGKTIINAD